jgi:hypothetical protein
MRLHLAPLARYAVVVTASACWGQVVQAPVNPGRNVEIKLPSNVSSEGFFIRYCLTGEFGGYCGWVQPQRNVRVYTFNAAYGRRPATRVRAVLYAQGCAVETFDFSGTELHDPSYSFACRPLPVVPIDGIVTRVDRLYGRRVGLRARYIPYWAESFFGIAEGIGTMIPVGDLAYPTADNHFRLFVPDFSQDSLAGAADRPGALEIWATDRINGATVALLIPTSPMDVKIKMGGLKIRSKYPPELVFAPCLANPSQLHDSFGFALRPGADDACGH